MNLRYNILIIEDNIPLKETLFEALSINYTVFSATNSQNGLNIVYNNTIHLIVLDIMLPLPLDGFEILKILKNDKRFSAIPVVIISALQEEESILMGLEYGANDFITKPFSEKQLLLKIHNLLSFKTSFIHEIEKQKYIGETPNTTNTENNFEAVFKQQFELVVNELIQEHNCTNSAIASKLSISIPTLERRSKRVFGQLPQQFVLNVKLQKANVLLRQKYGTVNDIAYAAGFNSTSYFCTCFKKKYNITPSVLLNENSFQ
ncbi:MAG: response regulator transcription factor [Ferruginibacter sp.]